MRGKLVGNVSSSRLMTNVDTNLCVGRTKRSDDAFNNNVIVSPEIDICINTKMHAKKRRAKMHLKNSQNGTIEWILITNIYQDMNTEDPRDKPW